MKHYIEYFKRPNLTRLLVQAIQNRNMYAAHQNNAEWVGISNYIIQ